MALKAILPLCAGIYVNDDLFYDYLIINLCTGAATFFNISTFIITLGCLYTCSIIYLWELTAVRPHNMANGSPRCR